ncbi:hypothetical protein M2323_000517 [Rhodoblastus acidophilus]|uniref:hypothetical protein n=1 Tax=Rhodoblastus acidophilus TaxID=1074 RepID=UPI0022257CF8|nr:hypothetical protein [Rhodoblastus acidophilus]MCW2282752.1 hypothetical protein [Rhodoblastus acidophilus]MCW2331613.1 hypothetical protein [Rhodoblastus acidophilus]
MSESADQIAPDDLTPEERAAYRASRGVLQNCAQTRPRPLCRAPDCLTPLPPQEWRAARKKLCAKSAKQGPGAVS